ncbi:FAD-dependent oxidoreductase [Ekhidna sp. MALMAid0563]|uniref:flavin monoamine oxidase family protein n=1 Tax=Ekhidna sp. MALMAid0563 TaxID=3143937 RepID=UPI0032E0179F
MASEVTRRKFIKTGGLAATGLIFGNTVGLGKTPNEKPKQTIIIIGAGLSGLSAGYELKRNGHDVIILEGQSRPGGRVQTHRYSSDDKFHVELGAGRFPKSHELTMKYVNHFGLEVSPFYADEGNMTTLIGSERIYNPYDGKKDINKLSHAFTSKERQLGADGIFKHYLLPTLQKADRPFDSDWINEELAEFDQLSWTDFLRSKGLSTAAINFINNGVLTEKDGKQISALWLFRDMLSSGKKYKIVGGNDKLPSAFARELEQNICYSTRALAVDQNDNKVAVYCEREGERMKIVGDHVILAIPSSVLKQIDVSGISNRYADLIGNLTYASASRVTLRFSKRSWETKGLNGFAATDHPLQVWHPTFDQKGKSGILQTYIRTSLSSTLSEMSEEERMELSLSHVEDVFPHVGEYYIDGFSKCWDNDSWAKGAAAVAAPGFLSRYYDDLQYNEGRIYFAGEHLSPWPAWMQGALFSGTSVAARIQNKILDTR